MLVSKRAINTEQVGTQYAAIVDVLCAAFGDRLRTIVLFGSQARGEARPESDHDLLVVMDDLPRDPLKRMRVVRLPLLPILHDLPGDIGFAAMTPEELAVRPTALLLDACVDGICLYGTTYFEPYRQKALAALRESTLQRRDVGGQLMWIFPDMPKHDWELTWDGYREYK